MKKYFGCLLVLVVALFFSVSAFAVDVMPVIGSNLFFNGVISEYTILVLLVFAVLKLIAVCNPAIPHNSVIELLRRWIYKFPVAKRTEITIFKDELKLISMTPSTVPAKKK